MKTAISLMFSVLLFTSLQAQTLQSMTLSDSLSFVPHHGINLRTMPVNVPSANTILSNEFSIETMTGGFLNIFLTDRSFNTIKPFSLRDYSPTSVSNFNSYIYRNYFLIEKQTIINDW
jgi:hypothetical protein